MSKRGRPQQRKTGKASSSRSKPRAARPRQSRAEKLFASAPPPVRCYLSKYRDEMRQCSVLVFRDLPTGGHAMAGFLVDLGCAGLKDAWGQLHVTDRHFINNFLEPLSATLEIEVTTPAEALRLVRGAARFAAECGFRLPNDWERWAAMLGEVGDWRADGDISEFEMEFSGTEEDLRLRLVDSTVEEFLARDDVDVYLGEDGAYVPAVDADDVAIEEGMKQVTAALVDEIKRWCFGKGLKPHPRLAEAVPLMLMSTTGALEGATEAEVDAALSDDLEAVAPSTAERMGQSLRDLLSVYPPQDAAELRAAVEQFMSFVSENPNALLKILGDDDDLEDDG
jgi:hypothetical protein